MTKLPLISIITPMYNVEPYLVDCIESVLAQSFTDWELILIDDCGPDHSCAIARTYAEKFPEKIRLICLEKNSGSSVARNKGLETMRGEWVTFLDADDYFLPNTLQTLYEQTVLSTEVDLIYTSYYYEEKGGIRTLKHQTRILTEGIYTPDIRHFGEYGGMIASYLLRTEIVHKYNLRIPVGLKFSEDFLFFFSIWTSIRKIRAIETAVYVYRRNALSITHQANVFRCLHSIDSISYMDKWIRSWDLSTPTKGKPWKAYTLQYLRMRLFHPTIFFRLDNSNHHVEALLPYISHILIDVLYLLHNRSTAQEKAQVKAHFTAHFGKGCQAQLLFYYCNFRSYIRAIRHKYCKKA